MSEELDNIIILNDENGKEVRFEYLDLVEYQGKEYVILYPLDDEDDPSEVIILGVEVTDDGEESYVGVEDENILMAVFSAFKEKNKDEFNFSD